MHFNIGLTLAAEYEGESCNTAQTTNDNINSFLIVQFKFSPIPVVNFASVLRGLNEANKATALAPWIKFLVKLINYQQV